MEEQSFLEVPALLRDTRMEIAMRILFRERVSQKPFPQSEITPEHQTIIDIVLDHHNQYFSQRFQKSPFDRILVSEEDIFIPSAEEFLTFLASRGISDEIPKAVFFSGTRDIVVPHTMDYPAFGHAVGHEYAHAMQATFLAPKRSPDGDIIRYVISRTGYANRLREYTPFFYCLMKQ